MRGLKTQENESFLKFFELIGKEAERQGCFFFADAGDGNVAFVADLECEDMWGWLIPDSKADKFEKIWLAGGDTDKWDDFYVCTEYKIIGDSVKITFQSYD